MSAGGVSAQQLAEIEARLALVNRDRLVCGEQQIVADVAVLVEAVKALRAALTSVTGACEQVAWTNRGMADVSRDGYWSFVPTEAVRRAAAVLGTPEEPKRA